MEDESMDVFCESVNATPQGEEVASDTSLSEVRMALRYSQEEEQDEAKEGERDVLFDTAIGTGDIEITEYYTQRESEEEHAEIGESQTFADVDDPTETLQKVLQDSQFNANDVTSKRIKQEPTEGGSEDDQEPKGLLSSTSGEGFEKPSGSSTRGRRPGPLSSKTKDFAAMSDLPEMAAPEDEPRQSFKAALAVETDKSLGSSSVLIQRLSDKDLSGYGVDTVNSAEDEQASLATRARSLRNKPGNQNVKEKNVNLKARKQLKKQDPPPAKKRGRKRKVRVESSDSDKSEESASEMKGRLGRGRGRKGKKSSKMLKDYSSSSDNEELDYSLPAVHSGRDALAKSQKSTRNKSKTFSERANRNQQHVDPASLNNKTKYTEVLESIKVYVFTCGHACSMCNSEATKEWLRGSGFHTARPSLSPDSHHNHARQKKSNQPSSTKTPQTNLAPSRTSNAQTTNVVNGSQAGNANSYSSLSVIPPNILQNLIGEGKVQIKILPSTGMPVAASTAAGASKKVPIPRLPHPTTSGTAAPAKAAAPPKPPQTMQSQLTPTANTTSNAAAVDQNKPASSTIVQCAATTTPPQKEQSLLMPTANTTSNTASMVQNKPSSSTVVLGTATPTPSSIVQSAATTAPPISWVPIPIAQKTPESSVAPQISPSNQQATTSSINVAPQTIFPGPATPATISERQGQANPIVQTLTHPVSSGIAPQMMLPGPATPAVISGRQAQATSSPIVQTIAHPVTHGIATPQSMLPAQTLTPLGNLQTVVPPGNQVPVAVTMKQFQDLQMQGYVLSPVTAPPGSIPTNPSYVNFPGTIPTNPPNVNVPGTIPTNPPNVNFPGTIPINPPNVNVPGTIPTNPPNVNVPPNPPNVNVPPNPPNVNVPPQPQTVPIRQIAPDGQR